MTDTDALISSRPAQEASRRPDDRGEATGARGGDRAATAVSPSWAEGPAGTGQVLGVVGRPGSLPPALAPVALSALMEGLGQAYNGQPLKAAVLVPTGLALSTAGGPNTWLARRVFGARDLTFGTDRVRPGLLAAWAATYAYGMWDAWAGSEPGGRG